MAHHLITVYNHYNTLQVFLSVVNIMLSALVSIEIIFTNGCRAPPWRQAHGDICYLQATPHDGDVSYVTASTEGYYINGVRSVAHITHTSDHTIGYQC